jgi:hypothetical protein
VPEYKWFRWLVPDAALSVFYATTINYLLWFLSTTRSDLSFL